MMRIRSIRTISPPRWGLALIALLSLALFACDDQDLNQFGAEGAHQAAHTAEITDFAISGETIVGPDHAIAVAPHSDFTLQITNSGAVIHSLTLYADEAGAEQLATSGPIPPGARGELRFHFHDPQRVFFRDDAYPQQILGVIDVR